MVPRPPCFSPTFSIPATGRHRFSSLAPPPNGARQEVQEPIGEGIVCQMRNSDDFFVFVCWVFSHSAPPPPNPPAPPSDLGARHLSGCSSPSQDTEFPGVVVHPVGNFNSDSRIYWKTIQCNVNMCAPATCNCLSWVFTTPEEELCEVFEEEKKWKVTPHPRNSQQFPSLRIGMADACSTGSHPFADAEWQG